LAIPVFSHEDPIHACPLDAAAPVEAIVADGPAVPVLAHENTEIDGILTPGNLEPYRAGHWKSALFLADGIRERYHPLAETVAKVMPDMKVIKADYEIKTDATRGNLRKMFLDNTLDFPLEDDSQDIIIMRSGLCTCRGPALACGGIAATVDGGLNFFSEVARVLNKKNPHAVAYLHGGSERPEMIQVWAAAAKLAMKRYPDVKFEIIADVGADGKFFNAIKITPRSAPEPQSSALATTP
jgi:hypothetical protein